MRKLESKLPNSGTTIFAIMSKMATDHNAINLSQGFPDFPISEELIDLVTEAMKKGMKQLNCFVMQQLTGVQKTHR